MCFDLVRSFLKEQLLFLCNIGKNENTVIYSNVNLTGWYETKVSVKFCDINVVYCRAIKYILKCTTLEKLRARRACLFPSRVFYFLALAEWEKEEAGNGKSNPALFLYVCLDLSPRVLETNERNIQRERGEEDLREKKEAAGTTENSSRKTRRRARKRTK